MIDDIGKIETKTAGEIHSTGEICSVMQCEEYVTCVECHSKVKNIDGICGECTSDRNILHVIV